MILRTLFTLVLISASAVFVYSKGKPENQLLIDVEEAERLLSRESIVLIDIRDQVSYAQGHLPGAILVPLANVESMAAALIASNLPIIAYCSCPAEESSLSAAFTLRDLGASDIYVLQGGYSAWIRAKKPIVTGSDPV